VAFAEIEKLIDTPVKHYSSGMYVRLAFSVAAHLDTDILLVDEVLSVGDVKFQQKCMGRMQDRTFVGKTILFVSHNLPAVGGFCGRTLLLEGGRVATFDSTHSVLPLYLGAETVSACEDLTGKPRARKGFGGVGVFRRIRLASHGSPTSCFRYGEPFEVIVDTRFPEECKGLTANLGVAITDPMGNVVLGLGTREFGKSPEVQAGEMQFRATVKRLLLMPGRYFINLYMDYTGRDTEAIERAIAFEVAWAPVDGVVRPPIAGVFFYPADWEVVAGNRA
jgi:lipopolysaccharide transport system ATP-binding protein